MARHDEGYYEDDPEHEDLLAPEAGALRDRLRQRLAAVFGTSYGISILLHLMVVLILATIVITQPAPAREAVIEMKRLPPPVELPERERDMEDTPPVPLPEVTPEPFDTLEEEVVPVDEPPRGDPTFMTNKMNPDPRANSDAFAIGGPGAAGAHGQRTDRGGALRGGGGGVGTEKAVDAALRWLMRHQSPDGRWSASGWQARCANGRCSGPGTDQGAATHDVGVTALALLAFLGQGHTHRAPGPFRETVRKAAAFLRRQAREDGSIGFDPGKRESIYDHAIATMALCELVTLTRDLELRRPAQAAAAFCVNAQNPGLGWRYAVRTGENDVSVTGWMILALKAARLAGFEVPDASFDGARAYLDRATSVQGDVGYMGPGTGSAVLQGQEGKFDDLPVMTSVSVLCRVLMGERRSTDACRQGQRLVAAAPPVWAAPEATRTVNFYYWYYGTYCMFQLGGRPWTEWNQAMIQALCPTQRTDGCADGSWDGVDEWSLVGGRVYATAINALTLEIYYRYKRQQEEPRSDIARDRREREGD